MFLKSFIRFSPATGVHGVAELSTHAIPSGEAFASLDHHVESVSALAAEGPMSSSQGTLTCVAISFEKKNVVAVGENASAC